MQRILNVLTHPRTLSIVGIVALAAILFIVADMLQLPLLWAAIAFAAILALWLVVALWRRWRVKRANQQLGQVLEEQAETGKIAAPAAAALAPDAKTADLDVLRTRLSDAVKTIKTSKIGQVSGGSALYELPWYIVIGNPAAGKSSAVLNSGLQFPFADKNSAVIHGIGGTRNCDWFFTTEGILLDTAGRYSVHEEDRSEWLGFLGLLKRYRPKAPINGIIVTASIAELTGNRPEFAINLAKNLRQRVQELTEKLEVFAPVYVMFTKADLITGFTEFFSSSDKHEYDRVWGATLPYEPDDKRDVVAQFDTHFEELYEGLKEISVAQLSLSRGNQLSPGQLSFPLEFSTIKPSLRAFLATLFENNPFQYKPIFRGFYFTSALQEGETNSAAAQRIAQRFGLDGSALPKPHSAFSKNGFFLRDLFSKVIFADRQTVRQFASPTKTRLRYATFFGFVAALALALGGWTWSTIGNQQLVANVQADLDNVTRLQQGRNDLQSRLQAMDILEDRIEQLEQFRRDKPVSVSLGLYQGDRLEQHLLTEYYNGVRQILLAPVSQNLASFMKDVNAHPEQLVPMTRPPESGAVQGGAIPVSTNSAGAAPQAGAALAASGTAPAAAQQPAAPQGGLYSDASPTNVQDAYNALKTYLMLSDKRHVEQAHLTDQLARFWRGWLETNRGNMPRDEMIKSAERMISFYLSRVNDDDWPMIDANLALVDQTRENLRRVVRGMPARQRVYEEIKARASTRFAPMTIARIVGENNTTLVAGSYAIPGTFTREAWFQYVQPAIREAATKELQAKDWVLNTSAHDDLTLEGSPEQIQKALVTMYKTEYAMHWQKFMQGIAVQSFGSFGQAVDAMNRLGDPQDSPIRKVLETAYDQTSWDNPSLFNASLKRAQSGVTSWFKQWFSRAPTGQLNANIDINGNPVEMPMGPIGQEFSALGRIVQTGDNGSMLKGYMDTLSKVRTRFNVIKNQGDPGPGARQLMQQTLDGSGSELADSLKYVDEQMLTGLTDSQRKALRPLLVRPLMAAYAVVIQPASVEVNKVWNAQVYQTFQNSLASKYPFAGDAKVEAGAGEIAQVFGPDGSIAKFVGTTLGPLAVRRGDTLTARTWGDMGLALTPDFTNGFARWVAPLAGGAAGASAGQSSAEPQTVFQIQPQPSSGTTEYTLAIDGQQMRYRNTPPQWTNFVWPNPSGSPGATLSATTFDGRTLQLVNEPGRYGLEKLINSAQRKRRPDGTFDLSWTQGNVTVAVSMRIISTSQASGGSSDAPQQQSLRGLRLPSSVADVSAAANSVAATNTASSAAPVASAAPAARPAAAAVSNTGGAQ